MFQLILHSKFVFVFPSLTLSEAHSRSDGLTETEEKKQESRLSFIILVPGAISSRARRSKTSATDFSASVDDFAFVPFPGIDRLLIAKKM